MPTPYVLPASHSFENARDTSPVHGRSEPLEYAPAWDRLGVGSCRSFHHFHSSCHRMYRLESARKRPPLCLTSRRRGYYHMRGTYSARCCAIAWCAHGFWCGPIAVTTVWTSVLLCASGFYAYRIPSTKTPIYSTVQR